jgi:hypothetical protein
MDAGNIPVFTKESLIAKLEGIAAMGWIKNARSGNVGGIGNTLEDLLGIKENNLPIPNAAEWELKTQRLGSTARVTLCHSEPSPRAIRFVPSVLLPLYGWPHQNVGKKYPETELSFRQTISARDRSDRGFCVVIDRKERKVLISFDALSVDARHHLWLSTVKQRAGLEDLNPHPYWGFDDLAHDVGAKLHNSFFVQAEVQKRESEEYYRYCKAQILSRFKFDALLKALENGTAFVDFDARTGHNHGTKFRVCANVLPSLFEQATTLF